MALIIYKNKEETQARFYAFSGIPDALGQLLNKNYHDEMLLRKIFAHEKNIMTLNDVKMPCAEKIKWFDPKTRDEDGQLSCRGCFYESLNGVPKADNPYQYWLKYGICHQFLYLYENSSWQFSSAGHDNKAPNWIPIELAILANKKIKNLATELTEPLNKEEIACEVEFLSHLIRAHPALKPHLGNIFNHWHRPEIIDVFECCLIEHDLRALSAHELPLKNKIKI